MVHLTFGHDGEKWPGVDTTWQKPFSDQIVVNLFECGTFMYCKWIKEVFSYIKGTASGENLGGSFYL